MASRKRSSAIKIAALILKKTALRENHRIQHEMTVHEKVIVITFVAQNWPHEVIKLKAKYESLQRTQRHLLGEDLGPLSIKELQNLEKQLEIALAQTRQRKTQVMMEQMEELRRKQERHLDDVNKQLKTKVSLELSSLEAVEGQGLGALLCPWNSSNNASASTSSFPVQPSQANHMNFSLEPVLQIGYPHYMAAEGSSGTRNMAVESDIYHGWNL
nr:MADS-box transcription factor 6 [Ipomoea batatas]